MGKHSEVSTPLSVSFIRLLLNLSNNTATNLISCDLFFPSDNIEKTAQHLDGIKSKNKNNQTIIYINLTRGRARSHFTILLYCLGDFSPPLGTFVLYHSLGVLSTPILKKYADKAGYYATKTLRKVQKKVGFPERIR